MASANKKGWNALMLSELIDEKCCIPEYIQNALVFVAKVALKEKRNYKKIMRQYGEAYTDVSILSTIAEQPEISFETLLQLVNEANNASSAIKLLGKVVEK